MVIVGVVCLVEFKASVGPRLVRGEAHVADRIGWCRVTGTVGEHGEKATRHAWRK